MYVQDACEKIIFLGGQVLIPYIFGNSSIVKTQNLNNAKFRPEKCVLALEKLESVENCFGDRLRFWVLTESRMMNSIKEEAL